MRPIIGITTHLSEDERTMQLNRTYSDALIRAGGIPLLLPATLDDNVIDAYVQHVDGMLLSGGGDVDPLLFGETTEWACGGVSVLRDTFELKLCAAFLKHPHKPVLGICRGFQVMNVALGGTLYQDIQSGYSGKSICHRQKQRAVYPSHAVRIVPDTRLHGIVQSEQLMVNSLHHQALKALPDGFIASALASDGIIEAAELTGERCWIGVQWHPEQLCGQPDCEAHERIFQAFVSACQPNEN